MTAWGSVAELLGEDLEDVELLGRGSSGVVYRARQRSLGRTVAVKVFNQFADDADRVLAEARAQAGLSWHANIVSLYGQGLTADGFPYLVMEYAGGGSLKDRIEADGPLSDPELLMVGAGLATALDAAHRAGVVHCDVKPSNVLFASDGSVRLADFGIAKSAGVSTGTIDSVEGSLGYVAPELLDGERQAAANDVYSLAITLSFARSGQAPLPDDLTLAQAIAAVHAGVPAAEARLDGLPEPVGRLLRDSCSTRPSGRPGASDLADAMWEATRSPAGQADGPGARNRWSRMVAAGALVAVVALLGVLLARSPEPAAIPVVDEEPAFDLCGEYAAYVDERTAVFDGASSSLEQSTSPVEAADRLIRGYPDEFGVVAAAYIQKILSHSDLEGEVTADQLATMAMADNLRVLGGGKPFLFDGTSGSFDPAVLPVYLAQPARMFSEVNRYSSERCPDVVADFAPARARLSSAIFSNLSDPVFMERFFEDPESFEVFDSRTTILVATYAWQFFEGILLSQPEWFVEALSRDDDIRRVLSYEHPETLLEVARSYPGAIQQMGQGEWLSDLQTGIDKSLPVVRLGIALSFGPELEALGLEVG